MNQRVLLVDDEANLLQSLKRLLRGRYDLTLAVGGQTAIDQIRHEDPFAVIVCDMQMPDVSGLDVLSAACEHSSDSSRIMLTGNVDQQTTVDAINSGAVFRFLNKPCPTEKLCVAIEDGIRQFQLLNTEKELLSETVRGAVSLVSNVMALTNPTLADRGVETGHLARRMAEHLGWEDPWQYEVAAMLANVGCIGSPKPPARNDSHDDSQSRALNSSQLVSQIPRLETVAEIIRCQFENSLPNDTSNVIRRGSHLLRTLSGFNRLRDDQSVAVALDKLDEDSIYDSSIIAALRSILVDGMSIKSLSISNLRIGMVLEDDLCTNNDILLLRKGTELNSHLLNRISIVDKASGIKEPIVVRVETVRDDDPCLTR